MLRTWRKRRTIENENYIERCDLAKFCDCKEEIQKWEEDVLLLPDHSDDISRSFEVQLHRLRI